MYWVAVLFAVLAGYFALGLRGDPSVLPSALIDKPAPEFSLPALGEGPGLARADLAGGVTLVNFFASWCAPCRVEHPLLMRLKQEGRVALYGIDYKDKPEEARRLLAQLGDPYRHIGVDRDGRTAIDFGVYGVLRPTSSTRMAMSATARSARSRRRITSARSCPC